MIVEGNRFTVRVDEVAAKVFDGEAIIINLENGLYYSLAGVGCEVWMLIEGESTVGEMATIMADRFAISRDVVLADLERVCSQLQEEGLVRLTDTPRTTVAVPQLRDIGADSVYAAPKLEVYRDMADLLALDPPIPGLQVKPARPDTLAPSGD
jgi:hypothetical protein